jgi:hypothetical protein
MANVSKLHGHVTAGLIVIMAQTKLIVQVVQMVNGIVAMANVFLHHMYVMDQVISVTQDGVLTVPMVQMKM